MTKRRRKSFEDVLQLVLKTVKEDSPITQSRIAEMTSVDWRTVAHALTFLEQTQDLFASHMLSVLTGRGGKLVWMKDRIDKMKLPDDVREWYIQNRFFKQDGEGTTRETETPPSDGKTPIDEAVRRIFKVLFEEDDLTIAEIARRSAVNRKTVDRALDLILRFQDEIADGTVYQKSVVIWKKQPLLHELDKTSLLYLLKKRYFPDEASHISKEKERSLLLSA